MKFHEIHGSSWNLLEFHEIPWKSQLFCEMEAFTSPWLKTLIFPRDSWWFWRFPGLENAESHIIPVFSWNSENFAISAIPAFSTPRNGWNLQGLSTFWRGGSEKCESLGISEFLQKFSLFTKSQCLMKKWWFLIFTLSWNHFCNYVSKHA